MTRPQVRASQLVMPFGPGAMMDLPEKSVIIAGLDDWKHDKEQPLFVTEPRLEEKLRSALGRPYRLRKPPSSSDLPGREFGPAWVKAFEFPSWFLVLKTEELRGESARRLVHGRALQNGKYLSGGEKLGVVPVRFVRACKKGHVGNIDWPRIVHEGGKTCGGQLWIQERGPTGDLGQVVIRCDCGVSLKMSEAADMSQHRLGDCEGARPWLGPFSDEGCGTPNRLLVRTASNAYFAETMSVVSIPETRAEIDAVVARHRDILAVALAVPNLSSGQAVGIARAGAESGPDLKPYGDDEVIEALRRINGMSSGESKSVKDVEFDALAESKAEIGGDRPDGDFFARALEESKWRKPWMTGVRRVVLVHRLREVVALLGFTRFEPGGTDVSGELTLNVERATLSVNADWLPAMENRGEGIFIEFDAAAIEQWRGRPGVQSRAAELAAGFAAWQKDHPTSKRESPPIAYTMLHTLSHLLMASIALECGYPSSSLRERIYAGEGRFGILILTASSDAEGTLGGLVEAGRGIARHFRTALDSGRLCSSDPICSHAEPSSPGNAHLTGAACHGCVLVPETSCEQKNDFLDRTLVVSTVAHSGAAFFGSVEA